MKPKPVLAVDIDDATADTVHHFARLLDERYGNPEGLTPDELVKKYRIIPAMGFWQTPKVLEWLNAQAADNDAQFAVPPVAGAVEALQKLSGHFEILYISSRPEIVREGTERWLARNAFPKGKLILRTQYDDKNGNAWKAKIIEEKYPDSAGIIDDNPEIIPEFTRHYKGVVYLFGDAAVPNRVVEVSVRRCRTWQEVLKTIV